MTIDQQFNLTPDATDQAIADAVNVTRYKPVTSAAVLEWLGAGGRLAKIKGFIAATAAVEDVNVQGLRAALEVLLMAATNPSAYLSLEPTSQQRQLLTFSVAAGVIDDADASALLAKAKTAPDVTAEDVAARRVLLARQQDAQTLADWANTQYQAMLARIGQDGPLPTHAELAAIVEVGS